MGFLFHPHTMRIAPHSSRSLALLGLGLCSVTACSRPVSPAAPGRDAVPLETDQRVYSLIQNGRCDEAANQLDRIPAAQHDVQWFMRRGDVFICAYRQSKSTATRDAVITHFKAGLEAFPDSSRLMLEYGVACTAWDDLESARVWSERARDLAFRRMAAGQPAYGFDDESAVKQQAEDLLRTLSGG